MGTIASRTFHSINSKLYFNVANAKTIARYVQGPKDFLFQGKFKGSEGGMEERNRILCLGIYLSWASWINALRARTHELNRERT